MAPHLSQQMRNCIVRWKYSLGKSDAEMAELAGCSERTVREVIRIHNEFGVVNNPLARPRGRTRVLDTEDVNYIASILDANPSLYLDEIQDRLFEYRGIEVSVATLCRTLHRIALSNKKVSKKAAERNELLRATWQAEYTGIPAEYFVWLDESSVDNRTNQRTNGWATVGFPCIRREVFVRGTRYSVLPALTYEGYIALDIFEGSVNKEKFISFIQNDVAPLLRPYPGPRSVVVLDNCSIHHDEEVRRIIVDECGAKLIYLPPYSPDMNPIEPSFHSLKAWLRRNEERVRDNDAAQPYLIFQAAASITSEMAMGWVQHSGYTFSYDM